jgi:PAS domain S-box-containing protein
MGATKPDGTIVSPSPLRVLILEDDPLDAKLTASALEARGYPVQFEVTDSPEVFRERLEKAEFDVILADYNLHNWTALDALEILKRSGKDVPLIVVTGSLGDEAAAECIKQGAADFVLKDRPARLPTAVQRAVEENRLREASKRAEEGLRQSEERFRLIAENVTDLIAVLDLEGNRLYNSPSYKEIIGEPDAMRGTLSFNEIHPDDREKIKHIFQETVRTGRGQRAEFRVLLPNGSVRFIESQGSTIRDEAGKPIRVLVVSRDVSERKQAEEALRESERKYRRLHESMVDGVVRVHMDGRITECNNAFCEMLGYTPEELLNLPYNSLIPEKWHVVETSVIEAEVLTRGYSQIYFREYQRKDGAIIPVEVRKHLILDESGNPCGMWAIVRDITERKWTEEMLREYEKVVEGSDEMIVVVDRQYRFLLANRAYLDAVGLEREEVILSSIAEVMGEEVFAKVIKEKLDECFQGKNVRYEAKRQFPRLGERDILASYFPIQGDHGVDRAAVVLQDITERKRAEVALRESEERFRLFMNNSPATAWMKDAQGRYVYLSATYEKRHGMRLEDCRGKTDLEVWPRAIAEQYRENDQAALAAGHPIEVTEDSLSPDGEHQFWLSYKFPFEDASGQVFVAGSGVDITERVRVEDALVEERRLLHTLMDNLPDRIYFKDRESHFTRINLALAKQYGLSHPAQAIGKTDFDFYSQDQAREFDWDEEEIIRTGQPIVGKEEKQIWPDGHVTWLSTTKMPVRNGNGEIIGTFGVSRDITERKRTEEALRESEKYYHSLFDNMLNALAYLKFHFDQGRPVDFTYLNVNKAFEAQTGLKNVVGKRASEIFPGVYKSDPELFERYGRVALTGQPERFEIYIKTTGRWLSVSAYSPQKEHVVVVFDVITERKIAEGALRDSEQRYHDFVEHSNEGVWRLEFEQPIPTGLPPEEMLERGLQSGYIAECNQAFARDLGFSTPQEIVGKRLPDLFPPSDQGRWESFRSTAQGGLTGRTVAYQGRDRSGNLRHWRRTEVPIVRDGYLVRMWGITSDITEKKLAEAELADRLRFETLLAELSARFVQVPAEQIDGEIKDAQRRVCESLALDACLLWQVRPEDPSSIPLTHIYRPWEGAPIPEGINAGQYLPWSTQQILAGKVSVVTSPDELPPEAARDRQTFGFFGIKSVLMLGLSVGGGPVVGGLAFSTRAPRPWPEELVKRLHLVAELFCSVLERQRAERVLQESEERFRSLVENATVGIYRTTPDGQILMANPALVRMLGFADFKQLAARNLEAEGFEPDYSRKQFHDRMEQDGEVTGLEEAWTRQDGPVIFVRESARAIRGEDGKTLYYDGIVEDITERKQAEGELLASEIRYRRLFEAAHDGVLILDADSGEIKDVNPFLTDLLGFSRTELLGKKLWDLGFWKDVFFSKVGFIELRSKGYIRYDDLPLETRDGRRIAVEFVSNVYLADHQRVIQCNIRDISARKRAEAERTRLITAIEQSAEAVVITNTNGDIEYVNPAFTRITGYSREEALAQNPRILKSGKQDPALYQELWSTISQGKTWRGEVINRRKDGSLYNEQMVITPVQDEQGKVTHFIAVKQDVTEHKHLEEQVRQAQKMEAVGQLAGGVAHDFNNLLTIINGYSELVLGRLKPNDPMQGYLEEIKKAGERAASLTRQLMAFSRLQVLSPRVLDLNALVAEVQKMLRRLIGEDIELTTVQGPALGRVMADPGQIEQILMNLAVNARDAMPQGGKLVIETANVDLDDAYARTHGVVTPGHYVMLAVSDSGCGMDAETQVHIFEPFFTTKELGKGTGLGLATVYGIVKQSGGYIWVYSEPGKGTTLKVYLPRVEDVDESVQAPEPSVYTPSGTETILLVEDEEAVRALASKILQALGYKVIESANPEDALRIGEHYKEPIHLLLTDVVMPRMSGREVAERLAVLLPDLKVVYMSGYTDDSVVRHGVLETGTAFLQKPFTPAALARKIREVLDAGLAKRP